VQREVTRPPRDGSGRAESGEALDRQAEEGVPVECDESGYVQEIDHARLVAEAKDAGAVVHLLFRPGQFVFRGERMASVWHPDAGKRATVRVARAVTIGRHRTLRQDPEFGVAQIVEIALRALSPAVNDTFTGVACVDWMGDALLHAAEAPQEEACWFDAGGTLRLRVRAVRLDRLVRLGFDQIRQAAADNPAVLIRMLDTIRRIAPRMSTDAARDAMRAEADAIREVAATRVSVALDRADVEAAWRRATGTSVTQAS